MRREEEWAMREAREYEERRRMNELLWQQSEAIRQLEQRFAPFRAIKEAPPHFHPFRRISGHHLGLMEPNDCELFPHPALTFTLSICGHASCFISCWVVVYFLLYLISGRQCCIAVGLFLDA